jgi:hypothetical protein
LYNNINTLKNSIPKEWLELWKSKEYLTGVYFPTFKITKLVNEALLDNNNTLYIDVLNGTIHKSDKTGLLIKISVDKIYID